MVHSVLMMTLRVIGTIASGLLLVAVACGGDDEPSSTVVDGGVAEGGLSSGSVSSGGGTSGVIGTSGGVGGCEASSSDAETRRTIGGFIDTLPRDKPGAELRERVIDVIARSCSVFTPPESEGGVFTRRHCWAHLVASALKESSYVPTSVVNDAYGRRNVDGTQANDPTIGLLQLRFSSAIRSFVISGNANALACVGCALPAELADHTKEPGNSRFWAVDGPTRYMATTQDLSCNVGIGAWYYYLFASGNGRSSQVTYADAYCSGGGTAGNLVTGMISYVNGPDGGKGVIADEAGLGGLAGRDANAHRYVTEIKGWFDAMIPPASGKHPFFALLSPSPATYCR